MLAAENGLTAATDKDCFTAAMMIATWYGFTTAVMQPWLQLRMDALALMKPLLRSEMALLLQVATWEGFSAYPYCCNNADYYSSLMCSRQHCAGDLAKAGCVLIATRLPTNAIYQRHLTSFALLQVQKPKGMLAVPHKLLQKSRRIYIFRHAERVDVTFGKQWLTLSFDDDGALFCVTC